MSLTSDDLTVAMITWNEEKAVGKVIADIRSVVPDAEILVVDSSSDRTAEIAESLGARVILQVPAQGYGPAMDLALRSGRGRVVVTLDCDDTYPVEFIEPLARKILDEGYDLVDASRLKGKPEAMPWINYLANLGFALLASLLFGRHFSDLHSGMRAYRIERVRQLRYQARGAALPVELLLRPAREGWKMTSVYIPYRERVGTSTMQPLAGAWWTLKRILVCRFGGKA